MSLIRGLLLITLMSFVPLCSSFDQFRCKAAPGCEIARCETASIHLQENEFPIICVSDDVGEEKIKEDEMKKLEDKIENLASDVKLLRDMNELQNEDMKRMRKQLNKSTKENKKLRSDLTTTQKTVADLEDKNKRLENDLATTQKTVIELKENNGRLENDSAATQKAVTELKEKNERLENDLMSTKKNITELEEKNKQLENDLAATQKTVYELQEQNKNFENDTKTLNKKHSEISATLTPTTSAVAVDSQNQKDENATVSPKSCQDVKILDAKKRTESGGVFDIYVKEIEKTIELSCDLETDGGGWTVFQRRMDGSEDFYRGWDDYVKGFGTIHKEFWMGLENLHQMTKNGTYEFRVDLFDFFGKTAYAKYGSFSIGSSADKYRLNVGSYSGTAGNFLASHNGRPFTTKDKDNDDRISGNCAQDRTGAWWYRSCASSNLNGQYHDTVGAGDGAIYWLGWKYFEYLKSTEMKFRRVE